MREAVALRNAGLDAKETAIGPSPIMRIRTSTTGPATEGAAATGTLLVEITLPSNYLANASSGTKVLAGSWSGTAVGAGDAGHFELFASDGTTRLGWGTCGGPGSGRELVLTNGTIAVDDDVEIATWIWTAGNVWS
jgi:hypothetical protein